MAIDLSTLDEFTRAYIEAALWSSNDESDESGGEPLDANYGAEDIADETLAQMVADCARFQAENAALITEDNLLRDGQYTASGAAGHDFWLTRNGHGAGFWDGDWEKTAGEKLTRASKEFGYVDLYVGDDGKIYA